MAPLDMGEAHIPGQTHAVVIKGDDAAAVVSERARWIAAERTLFGSNEDHAQWRVAMPNHGSGQGASDRMLSFHVHPLTADIIKGDA